MLFDPEKAKARGHLSQSWQRMCACCSMVTGHFPSMRSGGSKSGQPNGDSGSIDSELQERWLRGPAFGAVMLASSALNNLFVTYHLDFYLTVVRISPWYFYLGHGVFMVWNACNDALFGWLSDTRHLANGARRSRLPVIRYGGALWAAAFLVSWYPWSCTVQYLAEGTWRTSPISWWRGSGVGAALLSPTDEGIPLTTDAIARAGVAFAPAPPPPPSWLNGLNFMLNLCVYDAMLTLVEVNHHALLAEISVDSRARARYVRWSSLCAAIGSLTSWLGHLFWDKEDLRPFRTFAFVVAFACWGFFEFAAHYLSGDRRLTKAHDDAYDRTSRRRGDGASGGGGACGGVGAAKAAAKAATTSSGSLHHAPSEFDSETDSRSKGIHRRSRQREERRMIKGGEEYGAGVVPEGWHTQYPSAGNAGGSDAAGEPAGTLRAFLQVVSTFRRQRNFCLFAGISALQTFDCAVGKNFFTLFLELLVGDALSAPAHAATVSASFLLPWVGAAALSRVVETSRASLDETLRGLWVGRVVLLVAAVPVMLCFVVAVSSVPAATSRGGGGGGGVDAEDAAKDAVATHSSSYDVWARRLVALVVLLNRVASECVCRLVPLVESDLIDEHRYLQHQQQFDAEKSEGRALPPTASLGATMVGTANFISKPSQSLGPMVGFAVLSAVIPGLSEYGGDHSAPAGGASGGTMAGPSTSLAAAPGLTVLSRRQRAGVAFFLLALPLFCVLLQLLLFRTFSLKGRYLAIIKAFLSAAQDTSAV